MKLTRPAFYDRFVCIADRCTDNCCIGWEIDIDPKAMERFRNAPEPFKSRLCSAIHDGEQPVFAFGEGERCALLREDGLCELILNMGEDSLCDICALHPRFFEWFGKEKEAGLGMCCEEVLRLMFESPEPLQFVEGTSDEPETEECDELFLAQLKAVREELFGLLQRRDIPLGVRLEAAAEFTAAVQLHIDNGEAPPHLMEVTLLQTKDSTAAADRLAVLGELYDLLVQTEPINAEWKQLLGRFGERIGQISQALPQFLSANAETHWQYEHVAVYTLYRYFLKGVFDEEVVSKTAMACMLTLAAMLFDCLTWLEKGELSQWDRICNIKLLSKQLEYSDDNVEMLCDAAWDRPLLSPQKLAEVISAAQR